MRAQPLLVGFRARIYYWLLTAQYWRLECCGGLRLWPLLPDNCRFERNTDIIGSIDCRQCWVSDDKSFAIKKFKLISCETNSVVIWMRCWKRMQASKAGLRPAVPAMAASLPHRSSYYRIDAMQRHRTYWRDRQIKPNIMSITPDIHSLSFIETPL